MNERDYLILIRRGKGRGTSVSINRAVLQMKRRELQRLGERLEILINVLDDVADNEHEEGDYPGYRFFT
ncbi:MAG: hypothetical protein OXG49_10100 [Chloroflexi bacterium]|nr:hypothetical protein [Chloroflexota bacterium]